MKIKTLYDLTEQINVSVEIQDEEFFEILKNEDLILIDEKETLIYKKWSEVQDDFEDLFSVLKDYYRESNYKFYYDIQKLDNNSDVVISIGVLSDGENVLIMNYRIKFELLNK